MRARIYRPSRGATQSGRARTKAWQLDYERNEPRELDPLMGWTGSGDTRTQVRIPFDTKEEAIAFIERLGIPYDVDEPAADRERRGLSYSDNFRPGRPDLWTH